MGTGTGIFRVKMGQGRGPGFWIKELGTGTRVFRANKGQDQGF